MPGIPSAWANNPTQSAIGAFDITPNDSTDLAIPARALAIDTVGTLKVTMFNGDVVTFTANQIKAGINPIAVSRVWSTGTTATGIKGLT